MSITTQSQKDGIFSRLIEEAVSYRVAEITDAVAKEAAVEIRKRIAKEMDSLALEIFQSYDLDYSGNRLTITVRKPELPHD